MRFGEGEEEGSSGEETAAAAAGSRKRRRKASGEAIVEAMLEIAAASKMRAAAIMKSEERFSISKCIKLLDQLPGLDQKLYFMALDLFENPNARETFVSLRPDRRLPWLNSKTQLK